ncbi:unnamed protein product, partial [Ostreobium quekettii]
MSIVSLLDTHDGSTMDAWTAPSRPALSLFRKWRPQSGESLPPCCPPPAKPSASLLFIPAHGYPSIIQKEMPAVHGRSRQGPRGPPCANGRPGEVHSLRQLRLTSSLEDRMKRLEIGSSGGRWGASCTAGKAVDGRAREMETGWDGSGVACDSLQ